MAKEELFKTIVNSGLNYTYRILPGHCYTCEERHGKPQFDSVIHHEQQGQYQCPCGSFETRLNIKRKD